MVLLASNFDKSKYLKAADLDKEKKFRIKSATDEVVGMGDDKEHRLVLWFTNDERGLVLNRTNIRTSARSVRRRRRQLDRQGYRRLSNFSRLPRQARAGVAGAYPAAEAACCGHVAAAGIIRKWSCRCSAAAEGVSSSGRSGARRRAEEAAARGDRRRDSGFDAEAEQPTRSGRLLNHPGAAVGFEATAAVPVQGITMTKPTTHQRDLAKLPRALAPLIERPQWAVWRWTQKPDGKWQKPPYQARDPRATRQLHRPRARGAIIPPHSPPCRPAMLTASPTCSPPTIPLPPSTLDHCRDPDTRSIDIWAQLFLERGRDTYAR